jgi:transcriptional regulator with XRE-family HTH domain
MNFQDLHELLRLEVLRRIESGDLTGTRLAGQAGFQQGHISNFLNRKRALSLEGLDRVLAALGLTVEQILPVDVAAAAATPADIPLEEIAMVPIVSPLVAAEDAQIAPAGVIETVPVAVARLSENRARPGRRSAGWQRFVALRLDAQQAAAMEPLLASGTIAVIDRHYNSLAPYRAHQPTLYAVRYGAGLLLRHVESEDDRLILRPAAIDCAVQLIAFKPNEMPSDYIVGRACMLIHDL